ncbi:hypothetical protein ACPOL_2149 [Acidisarcina polymorpha]|uniref:Ribbon-helix-helix protein CopG domain-containing protein n=1 Tax=Acidisarcina polymorpha TaxID=2211140 RepID=A0A2Z5FX58_9BACT|nr:ribbon-helix-helix protein, CopG family [Acidisarcina polymorpha]AXC11473.1 hypothetical protein ACPOL_2149 [Acidisarcina polymorpha]
MKTVDRKRNQSDSIETTPDTRRASSPVKQRVLVEFPSSLLERADEAAARLEKSRSELIRTAVEKLLEGIEKEKFEQEMAEGYIANSAMNLSLLDEFAQVDREGF